MSQSSNQDLITQLQQAIQRASDWATSGWPMRFGSHQVEVSSLPAAEKMPRSFANRQEALAYWTNVAMVSQESISYGEKALKALQKGDLPAAYDALYFARFIEKRLNEASPTWGGICDAVINQLNSR
ncbi:MAG: hypothetical protein HQL60_04995 [Magnetococcales bacterium]|nr:hypothetical protein [Magnetococcales bacterium]